MTGFWKCVLLFSLAEKASEKITLPKIWISCGVLTSKKNYLFYEIMHLTQKEERSLNKKYPTFFLLKITKFYTFMNHVKNFYMVNGKKDTLVDKITHKFLL